MAWLTTKGFNLRASLGFVTDGTNQKFHDNAPYPVTNMIGGDSVTYGWSDPNATTEVFPRDRDAGIDVRLAGCCFVNVAGDVEHYFRIDLPATGQYKIRLALGDASFDHNDYWCDVRDNGSVLFNVGGGTVDLVAAHFLDANGTDLTAAAWPGSNAQRTITMTSTILQVVLRTVAGVFQGFLAHVEVEQVSGPLPTVNDAPTVTEDVKMHMPISLKMVKLS